MTRDEDDALFAATGPLKGAWWNRRDDPDHVTTDEGYCADRRCQQFRDMYPLAFTNVRYAALTAGGRIFTADHVRHEAQRLSPGLQPCHVNAIGPYWVRWQKDRLIKVVGTGRSLAASGKGTLNFSYQPVRLMDQLFDTGDVA